MKNNGKMSLISGIVFFVLGIVIFLNPDVIVKVISYGLGGLLILTGVYKIVNYYIQDKRLGVVNRNEIAFGITAVVLGIVFIFLASAIELLLRFIVGGWLIIAGLSKISKTFFTTDRDSKFYGLIIVGCILIIIGLYIVLVSNLALSIIGLFMMIYGLIDFISYFVYQDKKEIFVDETSLVIEADVMEAEIVEEDKKKKRK